MGGRWCCTFNRECRSLVSFASSLCGFWPCNMWCYSVTQSGLDVPNRPKMSKVKQLWTDSFNAMSKHIFSIYNLSQVFVTVTESWLMYMQLLICHMLPSFYFSMPLTKALRFYFIKIFSNCIHIIHTRFSHIHKIRPTPI